MEVISCNHVVGSDVNTMRHVGIPCEFPRDAQCIVQLPPLIAERAELILNPGPFFGVEAAGRSKYIRRQSKKGSDLTCIVPDLLLYPDLEQRLQGVPFWKGAKS